ncbi:ANTAR domain-containing response regulator [Abyssisolibacter fermentans]|uniref:ANTAR domain-containing response regulator n=1 Tax=Abyssisolibacter fermentans TaxID=1766203 RepID=UPI00082CE8F2|nr:ANTAR domain-containing protein [Abyssisolibacter fermentans]
MENYIIVVGDSNEKHRLSIVQLLNKKGYKVYEASDGGGVLRLARAIRPKLIILDVNIWGMNAFDVARIVESDNLSTIVFMTDKRDKYFYEKLKKYKLFAYLSKPINPYQINHLIEFVIMNSNKMNSLYEKVEKLESTLSARKKIDKAKGLLMQKMNFTEDEAFKFLRKRSMDMCISMEKVAIDIIKKY